MSKLQESQFWTERKKIRPTQESSFDVALFATTTITRQRQQNLGDQEQD